MFPFALERPGEEYFKDLQAEIRRLRPVLSFIEYLSRLVAKTGWYSSGIMFFMLIMFDGYLKAIHKSPSDSLTKGNDELLMIISAPLIASIIALFVHQLVSPELKKAAKIAHRNLSLTT